MPVIICILSRGKGDFGLLMHVLQTLDDDHQVNSEVLPPSDFDFSSSNKKPC